jgi:MSHA biogenesis protein MshL
MPVAMLKPGVGNVPGIGEAFRQRDIRNIKRELVVLLKPTIIHGDRNWQQDLSETRDRIRGMRPQSLPQ